MVSSYDMRLRRRRHGQTGFTLIEAIVSVAILTIIGGAVAVAFSVGIRAVGAGGPGDRSFGAHDFMILEERLGQDGARASCIKVTGDATVYGQNTNVTPNTCSSSTGYGKVSACSTAALCFAWPQTSGASWSCQVAVYASSGTAPKLLITRNEYTVPLGGSASAGATIPMTTDTVNFQVPALTNNNWVTAPGDYKWIRSLPVTITATQVRAGPFSQQIELHPVATDPGGAAALVTSSGSPC